MGWRRGTGWFYLRLPSFTIPAFTLDSFLQAARLTDGDQTLVLDLRLNAGGSLSCAGEVLGAFLGPDLPYAQTDLDDPPTAEPRHEVRPFPEETNQDHRADVEAVRSGPTVWLTPARPACSLRNRLVVLTGARTYSAGEVVAAAIREHARGTLVGARTAGAVVAADEYPIGKGWVVTLPFAHLRSGLGNPIEHLGVEPDSPRSFTSADTTPLADDEIDQAIHNS